MEIEHRIEVLSVKHKDLHNRIETLEAENAPDEFVSKLKKALFRYKILSAFCSIRIKLWRQR